MKSLRQYFAYLKSLYPEPINFYRVRMVLILGVFVLVNIVIFWAGILLRYKFDFSRPVVSTSLLGGGLLVISIAIMGSLLHRGYSLPVRLLIMGLLSLVAFAGLMYYGLFSVTSIYLLLLPLLASALFGLTGTVGGTLLSAGLIIFTAVAEETGWITPADLTAGTTNISVIMSFVVLLLGAVLLWFFTGSMQAILRQAQLSSQQLRTVAEIGQVANTALNSEQLLPQLVEMIRSQLSFYHVQVFLVDPDTNQATLSASTGRSGQRLLARGHSLPVGSQSVIGQATGRGTIVYATDTSLDPMHQVNEFLPATRSEIALPLFDGGQIMGALDVQSVRPDAFSPEDIETLKIMANQIAIAIRNARLFERFQASLEENQALYEETERSLQAVERLNRQLTTRAWDAYLSDERREYGVQIDGTTVHRQAAWTPTLREAIHNATSVVQSAGDRATITVPLDVRGQVMGAIEVTLPPNAQREDAQELVEAVANRLGLTLDNTRLFEEASTLAQQEHIINEIGGRLQAASEVDDMLQVALLELRQVLNAESGAVRLRAIPNANPAGVDSDIG